VIRYSGARITTNSVPGTDGHRCFGLLAGARFDLGGLGPIGRLMRNEATVGDALRSLVLHLHLHDRGATLLLLAPEPGSALLGYSIYNHDMPAIGQAYDAVVAMA
jgi:hypothetical protein